MNWMAMGIFLVIVYSAGGLVMRLITRFRGIPKSIVHKT